MRILNVTASYFPFEEFGGPPAKVRALSRRMTERGHEVSVLTIDWGLTERERRLEGEVPGLEKSPFGWQSSDRGIEAHYLPVGMRYRGLTWNPRAAAFCRARLRSFDIVHIFGLYDLLGPSVARVCQKSGTPYVVEPMGMFIPIVRSLRLKRLYHRALGRKMLEGARAIVATSEQEAAEVESAGVSREKVFVRRNGVEKPDAIPEQGRFRRALGIAADEKLILFLGRVSEKKSPDLLLRAFAKIHKLERAAMRLVIAGPDENNLKKHLKVLAADLRVDSEVIFLDGIYGQHKWEGYRDADVFVLPSQNENFGNAAGEAVLAGTPVILTDRCGIAPLLGDAALVVPHDVEAIAEALRRVLFEADVQARLRAACCEAVAGLSWEEPAREQEAMYRQFAKKELQVAGAGS